MAKNSISEVRDFHPIVADWLKTNGYPFTHHFQIADGEVDFYAQIDHQITLIECKTETIKSRHVAQLVGYCMDSPGSKGVLAIPDTLLTSRAMIICQKADVQLMTFSVDWELIQRQATIESAYDRIKGLDAILTASEAFSRSVPEMNIEAAYKEIWRQLPNVIRQAR